MEWRVVQWRAVETSKQQEQQWCFSFVVVVLADIFLSKVEVEKKKGAKRRCEPPTSAK
jgi:hypothetical protein